MAQDLRPSLQSACPWFGSEDVELIGNHPIAAGGFSDIWEGMYDGRKVVLKSYRCYMSFNVTQVIAVHHNRSLLRCNAEILLQRFYNEVHVWTLLHGRDANVVPLLGVYSTETHPFGLVYEYMDGLDLKQYLGNDPNVGRLKLVLIPTSPICYPSTFLPSSATVDRNSSGLGSHARPRDRPRKARYRTLILRFAHWYRATHFHLMF